MESMPVTPWSGKNLAGRVQEIYLDAGVLPAELAAAQEALLPLADGLDRMYEVETQREAAAALVTALPRIAELARQIRMRALGGHRFTIVRDLGFNALDEGIRDLYILGISALLGRACPLSETIRIAIWPVRPMAGLDPSRKRFNFSVSMSEADLHTDTSSAPMPEKLFALWCVKADAWGGGQSLLVDSRYVVESLDSSHSSRKALRILETFEFPFFLSAQEVTFAPIFAHGREPFLRYRPILIERGCAAAGIRLSKHERNALKLLKRRLQWKGMALRIQIEDGEVLVCNNHELLHGREAIRDPRRHLRRVRIAGDPVYAPPGGS